MMFEIAPTSLWLEDYSAVKSLFDAWRAAGVRDLRAYFADDLARVRACAARMRVIRVNRRTLSLFEADDLAHLVANLDRILPRRNADQPHRGTRAIVGRQRRLRQQRRQLFAEGRRIDIQVKGALLPGHETNWSRVLVAVDDVSEREGARRLLALSEDYSRGLFEHSPISLWVEDFSKVKLLLDEVRDRGIEDLRVFTDVHPEFVHRCIREIRVIDVNNHTLSLFRRPDKKTLLVACATSFATRCCSRSASN